MPLTIRKTTRHGQFHETLDVQAEPGEGRADLLKRAMAAGSPGYAVTWDASNQFHVKSLAQFLTMDTVSHAWSDYSLLAEITENDIASALTGSEQLPIVMTEPITGRKITASLNMAEHTPEVSIIVADPTGANGQREFIVTVREVDPEPPTAEDFARLRALLAGDSCLTCSTWLDSRGDCPEGCTHRGEPTTIEGA